MVDPPSWSDPPTRDVPEQSGYGAVHRQRRPAEGCADPGDPVMDRRTLGPGPEIDGVAVRSFTGTHHLLHDLEGTLHPGVSSPMTSAIPCREGNDDPSSEVDPWGQARHRPCATPPVRWRWPAHRPRRRQAVEPRRRCGERLARTSQLVIEKLHGLGGPGDRVQGRARRVRGSPDATQGAPARSCRCHRSPRTAHPAAPTRRDRRQHGKPHPDEHELMDAHTRGLRRQRPVHRRCPHPEAPGTTPSRRSGAH